MTDLQRRQAAPDPEIVQHAVVQALADEMERRAGRGQVVIGHVPPPAPDPRFEAARDANKASIRNAVWVFSAIVLCALALIVVKGLGWAAHSIPPSAPAPATTTAQPH